MRNVTSRLLVSIFVLTSVTLGACDEPIPTTTFAFLSHSSPMAVSTNGEEIFVVNADADSIAVINVSHRTLDHEILLAAVRPTLDSNGNYAPAVMPRALALSRDGKTLYVTGERSGKLYVVDVGSSQIVAQIAIGSEPVGVAISSDGRFAYAACSQDDTVVRVDTNTLRVAATAKVDDKPWALAWAAGESALLVSHFLGPGVTAIDPSSMAVRAEWTIPDTPPRGDARLAHGQVRGLYDLQLRPGTDEVWVTHAMLGTDTGQPALDFESTAFPSLSILHTDGSYEQTLSTNAQDIPGVNGAFADVVSGPQAVAFTHDGDYALVVDANSEDILVVDARLRTQTSLLRPLPGHFPSGIVLSPDEHFAYVLERNTSDVAVLDVDRSNGLTLSVNGSIPTLMTDPMPASLRLGQHIFNSADSDEYPVTTNHWISCATCHMEGRSDAVTWDFAQGPRDTPTNSGGMIGTGFLFRTADRTQVQDYWHTINVEQGGRFTPTDPKLSPLLDALAAYVNYAIPFPVPPTTDAALAAKGQELFQSRNIGCSECHTGPRFTDSGSGNPNLDLTGPIVLHDVGTCVSGGSFPDVAHMDVEGHPRAACAFDTPSLNGVSATAPYLHDGSARTLGDAAARMLAGTGKGALDPDDMSALVEYLRTL